MKGQYIFHKSPFSIKFHSNIVPSKYTSTKFEQPANPSGAIVLTLLGITILEIAQPSKPTNPISSTFAPIVISARLTQPQNAYLPILITLSGILTLVIS